MSGSDNEVTNKLEPETVLMHLGNKLKLNLKIDRRCYEHVVYITKKYLIRNSAEFQMKIQSYFLCNDCMLNNVFIKFTKLRENDELNYLVKVCYENQEKVFENNDGAWYYLDSKEAAYKWSVDVMVTMDIVPNVHSFPALYDDNEMTDFELRGVDGSVNMHKSVLAACSPVMKTMFSGIWRELSQGHVELSGTTRETLQMFKEYVYLHTLPDTGLEQLLLLASYYMMPDLEQKCADKLMEQMTADNAWELFEFTVQNKLMNLMITVLESVDPNIVNDMHKRFFKGRKLQSNDDKESQARKQRRSRSVKDAQDEKESTKTPSKLRKV